METAPLSPLTASSHQLHDILLTFERDLGGILGMAICDYRGKAIASTFPERTDAEELCGLVALAAGSARGTFRSLGTRGPTSSVLTGPDALLLTQDLEQARALLVAAVEKETNLGLVDLAMRATGRRLEQALLNNTPSAPRVEELFLMMRSGVLIGSTTRNSVIAKDKDLVAGMFSLVQAFTRDAFGRRGGDLQEIEMANLVVRVIQGQLCTLSILSTGSLGEGPVGRAQEALRAFEESNRAALESWRGNLDAFHGIDDLLRELSEEDLQGIPRASELPPRPTTAGSPAAEPTAAEDGADVREAHRDPPAA
ncbi:MAG TPA: hypothetical protein VJ397_07085 [Thermoplasmata archaeon]|nr:hypothetical protein [Thermoplasmata archaeon]